MYTTSSDAHHWPDESTADVAIRPPAARALPNRRVGTALTTEPLDLRDRSANQRHADRDFDLDPEELGLTELAGAEDAWMAEAACKGRTNLFFGRAGERPERRIRRERSAREVCATCPVVQPCRDRARSGRENGFWGAESEEERAAAGFPPRSVSRRSVQRASAVGVAAS